MNKKIPVRQVFIDRLLSRYSDHNKGIIDVLIDAQNFYRETQDTEPITQETINALSVYLRYRYLRAEGQIRRELVEHNRKA